MRILSHAARPITTIRPSGMQRGRGATLGSSRLRRGVTEAWAEEQVTSSEVVESLGRAGMWVWRILPTGEFCWPVGQLPGLGADRRAVPALAAHPHLSEEGAG